MCVLSTHFPPHLQGTPPVGLFFPFGCRGGAPEGILKLGDVQQCEYTQ